MRFVLPDFNKDDDEDNDDDDDDDDDVYLIAIWIIEKNRPEITKTSQQLGCPKETELMKQCSCYRWSVGHPGVQIGLGNNTAYEGCRYRLLLGNDFCGCRINRPWINESLHPWSFLLNK